MTDPAAHGKAASKRTDQKRRWPSARVLIGAVLLLLTFVFIIENREPAAIRVIIPIVVMPLWAALTAMFLVGLIVGLVWRRRS
jgi:uncharacterized integral membrane protein